MIDDKLLAEFLVDVAVDCGRYVRAAFRSTSVVETKSSHVDLVTEHDRHAEGLIRERLEAELKDVRIVGEEFPASGAGPLTCYVDPIDGTSNFVAGIPLYCVSIGVERDGVLVAGAVHDPERGETFWGTREGAFMDDQPLVASRESNDRTATCLVSWPYEGGSPDGVEHHIASDLLVGFRSVRRLGSAALGLAYVAAGRADVTSELIARPWDVAAGFLLVGAAGGVVDIPAVLDRDPSWYSPRYVARSAGFDLGNSAILPVLR